jgi:hypothetical protein
MRKEKESRDGDEIDLHQPVESEAVKRAVRGHPERR